MPTLYLIPSILSEYGVKHIPHFNTTIISELNVFIVEKVRTARRIIRELVPDYNLEAGHFFEIQNRKDKRRINISYEDAFRMGRNVGFLSEAGCPCVADPGSEVVNYARELGYRIVPLTGPSSILLALMASGLNGQQFSFHGYLPIRPQSLRVKLKEIEESVIKRRITQIFIETPYRNQFLFDSLLKWVNKNLRLCICLDITGEREEIQVKDIKYWDKSLKWAKLPAIFLIGTS